jgi:hypothetical protein
MGTLGGSHALPRSGFAGLSAASPTRSWEPWESRYRKCWPYQLNTETEEYEYKPQSDAIARLRKDCIEHTDNLRVFFGQKTFEYEVAAANLGSRNLAVGSCDRQADLDAFVTGASTNSDFPCVLDSSARSALAAVSADQDEKKKARFATCYLCCAEDAKGEHASALSEALRANLVLKTAESQPFVVPTYIQEALQWVCPPKVG